MRPCRRTGNREPASASCRCHRHWRNTPRSPSSLIPADTAKARPAVHGVIRINGIEILISTPQDLDEDARGQSSQGLVPGIRTSPSHWPCHQGHGRSQAIRPDCVRSGIRWSWHCACPLLCHRRRCVHRFIRFRSLSDNSLDATSFTLKVLSPRVGAYRGARTVYGPPGGAGFLRIRLIDGGPGIPSVVQSGLCTPHMHPLLPPSFPTHTPVAGLWPC